MRSLSSIPFLAAAVAIPMLAAASSQDPDAYSMSVRMVTGDNCPPVCPCVFGEGPTYGHCLFAGAAIIDEGKLGSVSLKGVKWGIIGEFSGEVRSGPKFGFHGYYVDSAASPEQKDAMKRILNSSPWSDFGESKGIAEAPIDVQIGKTPVEKWSFKIGDKGSVSSEPLRGGVDPNQPIVIKNPQGTFPGQTEVILGRAQGEFKDHGKTLTLKDNSGEHHVFTTSGKAAPKN
ncbi:MAG TPA: DUF1326 domain-containing protein [Planctomycetota bacterium]|jgi:hypothetical protein|nr:DUF1326 domain-containing protein [Planctomycetota bacterium]